MFLTKITSFFKITACDLVQGLCVLFKQEVTTLCGGYINTLLSKYATNPSENWKDKDAALTLFLGTRCLHTKYI